MKYVFPVIVVFVVVTWFLAFLFSAIRRDYTSLSILTPVVASLLGLMFAYNRKNGN